jgi:hypothetical protein
MQAAMFKDYNQVNMDAAPVELSVKTNRTKFKRLDILDGTIKEGQLSVVDPLPSGISPDFVTEICRMKPWNHRGEVLYNFRRRIEKFTVADTDIVLKEFEYSGEFLTKLKSKSYMNLLVKSNSPSAQIEIVDKVKAEYQHRYGQDLPVEELVASYIDSQTTKKYMFYKYYPRFIPDYLTEEGEKMLRAASKRVAAIDERFAEMGYKRGEKGNYLIVKDDRDPEGFKIVLIDTELWKLSKE